MKSKKIIIVALCAVLIFAAAFFGYDYLSKNYQPEQGDLSAVEPETEIPESENTSVPSEGSASEPEKEVVMAPDFTVYDADGNPVKLSDFSGKPVVINFWATWCGYCVKEMPAFESALAKYGDEVVFMMINVTDGQQETKEDAVEFIEENGFTFPVYCDTDLAATMAYGAWSLPATGFVTESGVFAGGQLGAMSEETLCDYIDKLLALE